MRLWMPLPIDEPFKNRFVPLTQISIEPGQNVTIGLIYMTDQTNRLSIRQA